MPKALHLLAISGSLRAASYHTALLRATTQLAPAGITVTLYEGIGNLPLFNPDLDAHASPQVRELRTRIAEADGVLIASPEYAHGITGVLKNALDWLVSQEKFVGKPVALFNASPRSAYALPALREVLKTMSAQIVEAACIALPLQGSRMDQAAIVQDRQMADLIVRALTDFGAAIHARDA